MKKLYSSLFWLSVTPAFGMSNVELKKKCGAQADIAMISAVAQVNLHPYPRTNTTSAFLQDNLFFGYLSHEDKLTIQKLNLIDKTTQYIYEGSGQRAYFFSEEVTKQEIRPGAFLELDNNRIDVFDTDERSTLTVLQKKLIQHSIHHIEPDPYRKSFVIFSNTFYNIKGYDKPETATINPTSHKKIFSDGSFIEITDDGFIKTYENCGTKGQILLKFNAPPAFLVHSIDRSSDLSKILVSCTTGQNPMKSFLIAIDCDKKTHSIIKREYEATQFTKALFLANPRYCITDVRNCIYPYSYMNGGSIEIWDLEEKETLANYVCFKPRDIAVHADGIHIAINDRIVDISGFINPDKQ